MQMDKKADSIEQSQVKESIEAEIADLKQQIYRLQMERDALEKAAELLKKSGRHQSDSSGKRRKGRGD